MSTLENSHLLIIGHHRGQPMPLDLRIEQCDHYPLARDAARTHPTPPYNRLFLFTGGGFCDVTLDGRTRRLDDNRFWLIPLYRTFHVRYPTGGHFYFVHFTAQAASGLDIFRQMPEIVSLPPAPALARRFVRLFDSVSPLGSLRFQNTVVEIVCRFADRPDVLKSWRENSLRTSYRGVLEHIRLHNRHGLRIEDLARLARMTPDALRKGFRRTMGVSLKSYLQNDLLQRALELLFGMELNITQICERLGYENPFYFARVFKRAMGAAPLFYRKYSRDWTRLDPTASSQPGRRRSSRRA